MIYLVTYVVVVNWTLLQVGVAVLLDNFISATHRMDQERARENRKVILLLGMRGTMPVEKEGQE